MKCISMSFLLAALAVAPLSRAQDEAAAPAGVERLQAEARGLERLVETKLGAQFLGATSDLPRLESTRTIYLRRSDRVWLDADAWAALPPEEQETFAPIEIDEWFHYTTRYGSSLAYVRALDLLAQHGFDTIDRGRILDYGFGAIGHLTLMASLGAKVTGFDPDSMLIAAYGDDWRSFDVARSDAARGPGPGGHVELVFDQLADGERRHDRAPSGAFDLFLSKNTLKRGYVHPEREVDPRMTIDIGADDETYVRHLHELLRPGGHVMIYNLSPKRSGPDEAYIPWSDGRCPFDRDLLEAAGFEVLAYDVDDSAFIRDLGRALGWDEQGMDLEGDLFAMYTILRKPRE
ncbi:MAG: hypothetical protein VYC34_03385 [Planctomycetota bacterium]|nr:hypothetical protein [Planctomycetota bacterium]